MKNNAIDALQRLVYFSFLDYDIVYQALLALEILKDGYFSTSYNPEGDYHHITFDIYGKEAYKIINEWLKDVKKVTVNE